MPTAHPSFPPVPAPPGYAPQGYAPQGYAPQPYAPQPYAPLPPYGPSPHAPQSFMPQPYGAPYPPAAARPVKSAGVAVLLSLLWIGAGHLYLDRLGTGLVLMGAHLFLGLLLIFIFPISFFLWLAAFITCAVVCSNLANQINTGTVPPRSTW
ncbi:hypothetical protein Acsp07_12130 [Actinomycetospora sp. NBRC 106378]|nr:hypothetical protein Acsp07_12130 [Actinomycetospora sp. NBRC 106378]